MNFEKTNNNKKRSIATVYSIATKHMISFLKNEILFFLKNITGAQ